MPIIINIDCSTGHASVCLSINGELKGIRHCYQQKEQSSFLQPAMGELLKNNNLKPDDLDAIAVTIGPGSYTGLRLGLSSAKGLAYALKKPLMTIGTLELMAFAARSNPADFLAPMIDARRQEVFTGVYTPDLENQLPPTAVVLEPDSYAQFLEKGAVLFFGDGADKWKNLCNHPNANFADISVDASDMVPIAEERYLNKEYADLAYSEPLYVKAFHDTRKS